jgi:hypothetical protein
MDNEKSAFTEFFKSVWGVFAVIITIVSMTFAANNYITKNFPSTWDLEEKLKAYVSKQEYFTGEGFSKRIEGLAKEFNIYRDNSSKRDIDMEKQFSEEISKLRAEYRMEKLIDITVRLKIVDELLLKDPDNRTLKNYREYLCKEHDRIQTKLDNSLKDLEKNK